MGVVYLAQDLRLKRQVAIKLLPPDLTRDASAKQRFQQEAQAASALDHPNICTMPNGNSRRPKRRSPDHANLNRRPNPAASPSLLSARCAPSAPGRDLPRPVA